MPHYRLTANSKVRAGFAQTSKDLGVVKAGQIIEALQTKLNEAGITRVRFTGVCRRGPSALSLRLTPLCVI